MGESQENDIVEACFGRTIPPLFIGELFMKIFVRKNAMVK